MRGVIANEGFNMMSKVSSKGSDLGSSKRALVELKFSSISYQIRSTYVVNMD